MYKPDRHPELRKGSSAQRAHASDRLKVGGLEHAGEARWGGGPARWPQVHLGSHGGPREYDGGEEIGLQPLGYGLDCKRGRSVVPQKGISPPPITADPGGRRLGSL